MKITKVDIQTAEKYLRVMGLGYEDDATQLADFFANSRKKACEECPKKHEDEDIALIMTKYCEECLQAKAMLALESLTPGGSEYVGDVKRCAEYVRERRSHDWYYIKKRVKELKGEGKKEQHAINALKAACTEFVRKCDCGEARSVRSYAEMKAALKLTKEAGL